MRAAASQGIMERVDGKLALVDRLSDGNANLGIDQVGSLTIWIEVRSPPGRDKCSTAIEPSERREL